VCESRETEKDTMEWGLLKDVEVEGSSCRQGEYGGVVGQWQGGVAENRGGWGSGSQGASWLGSCYVSRFTCNTTAGELYIHIKLYCA
jgi:hypothetical protein